MFCHQCGGPITEKAVFCPNCGTLVEEKSVPEVPEESPLADPFPQLPVELPIEPTMENKKRKSIKKWIIAGNCCVALCLLATFAYWGYGNYAENRDFTLAIEEGLRLQTEEEYGQAIAYYEEALALRPEDSSATLELAHCYRKTGEKESALSLLNSLSMEQTDERYGRFEEILFLSQFQPEMISVNFHNFPTVELKINCDIGNMNQEVLSMELLEDGEKVDCKTAFDQEKLTITYQSIRNDYLGEQKSGNLLITALEEEFPVDYSYDLPPLEEVDVHLVSSDVSAFPTIKTYFRVEDTKYQKSIANLDKDSFVIKESIDGGEFLHREVKKVTPLEGNAGLNIALIADKSDSISTEDMAKIKNVMTEFINTLHYEVGDKAEVLAFDTIVQQMCAYTDDKDLLAHGISQMHTDGMTAFYDAVYAGINHAALQGGARCVIAFTDGMDNSSQNSGSDVIAYANEQQVPLYIIGVGSSIGETELWNIANATGGYYWHIDDLYDMKLIFDTIYKQQKKMYVVEYETDATSDKYLPRTLETLIQDGSYYAEGNFDFSPKPTINDNGGVHVQDSKYQVILEPLTWEQASARCQEMGGHLATITSQDEMDELVSLAEDSGAQYLWIGGTTAHNDSGDVFGHWVTGEPFTYEAWSLDEPSRVDKDGTEEWYIMLWNIPQLGGWTWNDQRNDPVSVATKMAESMGFICEYD